MVARIFVRPDNSESDAAIGLVVSYQHTKGRKKFRFPIASGVNIPDQYFVCDVNIPLAVFNDPKGIRLEVLTLHDVTLPAGAAPLASIKFNYDQSRKELEESLAENTAMRHAPEPASHSFERRSLRTIAEAQITLKKPPAKKQEVKLIVTTCRYPGFAFESDRVDTVSFEEIAADHGDAAAMIMVGDQIYADATANLLDTLTSIEKFDERYHDLFSAPGFAKAVRSIPCYMTPDDHEFRDFWSKPDDRLHPELFDAARRSVEVYQLSHAPWPTLGKLPSAPYDYHFSVGKVAVYVMDTLSNRDTARPGSEVIVSNTQLGNFTVWLSTVDKKFVVLVTGAVVAPGFRIGLGSSPPANCTNLSRSQNLENWQSFNAQRVHLLSIIDKYHAGKKILLVSGDYHCAATASIRNPKGEKIAQAVIAPPAYAPMRFLNKPADGLAKSEQVGGYWIKLDEYKDGSGFAEISTSAGGWVFNLHAAQVADH